MRLYFTPTAAPGTRWSGTQDAARTSASPDLARGASRFDPVDVPTDKPTLIQWLNTCQVAVGPFATGGNRVDITTMVDDARRFIDGPADSGQADDSDDPTSALAFEGPPRSTGDQVRGALRIGPALAATPAGKGLIAELKADAQAMVDQVPDHYAGGDILANWAKRASPGDIAMALTACLTRVNELGAPAIDALTARLAFDGPAAAAQGALGLGAAVARTMEAIATLKVSTRGPWPAAQDIHRTPAD